MGHTVQVVARHTLAGHMTDQEEVGNSHPVVVVAALRILAVAAEGLQTLLAEVVLRMAHLEAVADSDSLGVDCNLAEEDMVNSKEDKDYYLYSVKPPTCKDSTWRPSLQTRYVLWYGGCWLWL